MMTLIVGPMMLIQIGIALLLLPTSIEQLRILLIALVWLATFSLSLPCRYRRHRLGKDPATLKRLVSPNWIRTLPCSLLFLESLLHLFIDNAATDSCSL